MPRFPDLPASPLVHVARRASAFAAVSLAGQNGPALAMLSVVSLPPLVVAAYLVKSALGINLLPGPSPLHDLFYHWVR
ncbi:MAG: hypothetical protein AB7E80_00950 [Hyphomicrobiaceae bacterium]